MGDNVSVNVSCKSKHLSYLAGEAVRMEGQVTRPHDKGGSWDWLEAASALTASKHPEQEEKSSQEISTDPNFRTLTNSFS